MIGTAPVGWQQAAVPGGSAATSMLTVGIDVGGTKTACVVTDAEDRVLMHEVETTDAKRLSAQLTSLARRAVERFASDTSPGNVAAVGVAIPGRVEPGSGNATLAVNLGGADLHLGSEIEESVGLPCYVEHDARAAAAWVYSRSGSSAEADDLAYLSVGTGIAAGIILEGRVLRGANGLAGEVGHTVADPDGPPCACGLRGCLEVVAAGPAIARLAHESVAAGRQTRLSENAGAADVFRAAAEGDPLATEITESVADHLARAIRGLVLSLGVRHVVIGGGVAAAGEALHAPLMAAIGRERAASQLAEAAFAQTSIELLSPQIEAGARGAAAIARRRFSAQQREGVGNG
jgi:glucokinase